MRLLLLFSALLTALAGVTGTGADARAPSASIAVMAAATPLAASRIAARSFAPLAFARPPLSMPPLPRLIGAAAARLLYAERRRE